MGSCGDGDFEAPLQDTAYTRGDKYSVEDDASDDETSPYAWGLGGNDDPMSATDMDTAHSPAAGFKRLQLCPPPVEALVKSKLVKRFACDQYPYSKANVVSDIPDCAPLWTRPTDGREPYWLGGNPCSAFYHPAWAGLDVSR